MPKKGGHLKRIWKYLICINHKMLLWFMQTSTSPKRTLSFTSGYMTRSANFVFQESWFPFFSLVISTTAVTFLTQFLWHPKETPKLLFAMLFRQRKSKQSISDATLSSSESESLTSISGNNTCLLCPVSSESRRELLGLVTESRRELLGFVRAFVLSSPSSSSDEDQTSQRSKSIETYGNWGAKTTH